MTLCADRVHELVDTFYFTYLRDGVWVVGSVAIMFTANWQSAVIYVAGIATVTITGRLTLPAIMAWRAKETDIRAEKNGVIIDSITGFTAVKSFRMDWREIATVRQKQDETTAINQKSFIAMIWFWYSIGVLVRVAI